LRCLCATAEPLACTSAMSVAAILYVRPSVRPSVRPLRHARWLRQTASRIITVLSPLGNCTSLVFFSSQQISRRNSDEVSLAAAFKVTLQLPYINNSRFSTNIWLYVVGNDSYYVTQIKQFIFVIYRIAPLPMTFNGSYRSLTYSYYRILSTANNIKTTFWK